MSDTHLLPSTRSRRLDLVKQRLTPRLKLLNPFKIASETACKLKLIQVRPAQKLDSLVPFRQKLKQAMQFKMKMIAS